MYMPPRQHTGADGRLAGSEFGTARLAIRLEEPPEALCAVGDEVYLVFRSSRNPLGGTQRLVYSVAAVASGLGDLWVFIPARQLRMEPALPGEGVLVGFAGTPVGPAALIDRGPREATTPTEGGESGVVGELGRTAPRPPPDLTLEVLWSGRWRPVSLPPEVPELGRGLEDPAGADRVLRRFMLASSADGLALLATRPARQATLWTCPLTIDLVRGPETERRAAEEARGASDDRTGEVGADAVALGGDLPAVPLAAITPDWVSEPLVLPIAADRAAVLPTGPLALVGSRVVFAHTRAEDGIAVFAVGSGPAERLFGVPNDLRVMPGGTPGASGEAAAEEAEEEVPPGQQAAALGVVAWPTARRIGLVLAPPSQVASSGFAVFESPITLRIVELSADTGAVVYDGPTQKGSPTDREGFQAILLVVLGVATILLVWTIRSGREERVIRMPTGSAMAPPSRRLVAGAVDYLVASAATGLALGVPLLDVMSLRVVMGPDAHPIGLLVLAGVGVGLSTLGEGLFGCSPGKLALGLRVVVVAGRGGGTWRPPGLARALARGLFRWVMAPLAVLGMARPDARHWGDFGTGTAVVIRVARDGEGPDDQGGQEPK